MSAAPLAARAARSGTWLVLALALVGCEPLDAAGNAAPRVVSAGPVRATDDGVALEFSVHDREADPVELEITVCRPAAGERCAEGAPACAPATVVAPAGNPLTLHGDPDANALTVRSITWRPSCQGEPIDPSAELALCLRPRDGAPLASPSFTLTSLGVAPGDTPPGPPCP